jgi:uncharacterized protein YjbI with pentapeptide repeats
MSDASEGSEQDETPQWGDPISEQRQAELQGSLDRWEAETDHGERKGPFAEVDLTGADVYWLAGQSSYIFAGVPNLHLEGAGLSWTQLEGANLREAHLEGANLSHAHLEGADFLGAHLEGAGLWLAHLKHANLQEAHFEGAYLREAYLEHANLRAAWFDKASQLNDAILTGVSLDRVTFDQTSLTVVDWSFVDILGDEKTARTSNDANGKPKSRQTQLTEYKSAVRANRILAVALRNQGMNEEADRFAERAQICQRELQLRRLLEDFRGGYSPWHLLRRLSADLFGWVFSWLLAVLAGYGYHTGRSVAWYFATIFGFAFAYYQLGPGEHVPFSLIGALVFSVTSFHGRGFFPGGSPGHSLTLGDPVTVLAAAEAVVGLVIEISFIATFTQRFFGR